jgi:hypothetical protein
LIHAVGFESKISVCRHPTTCIPPTLPLESITLPFGVYNYILDAKKYGIQK